MNYRQFEVLPVWKDFADLARQIYEFGSAIQFNFGNLQSQISDLIKQSEKISRQLYGLIENLKSSEISGQRHLDEKAKTQYLTKQSRQDFLRELDRINLTEAREAADNRKPP